MPLLSVCRKTQGLIRGRSPLWLYSDLATCAANPQKALAQQGFPCIRCWPRHRRKHRMKKLKKVAFSHFFDTLTARSLSPSRFCRCLIKFVIRPLPRTGCKISFPGQPPHRSRGIPCSAEPRRLQVRGALSWCRTEGKTSRLR